MSTHVHIIGILHTHVEETDEHAHLQYGDAAHT